MTTLERAIGEKNRGFPAHISVHAPLKLNATLPGGDKKPLKAAIGRVLTEVAVSAGIR